MTPPLDDLSRGRRTTVLLLWALVLAVAAAVIARTPFSADLSAFLPDRPDAGQQVLIEQLQSGVAARTLLIGIDGGSAAQRAETSRKLAAAMRVGGRFEQVQNGADLGSAEGGFAAVGNWLYEHRYALSPAVDPERFTADGLRDAIDETLSLLGTPAGNAIKAVLDTDPTGETRRIAEGLIPAHAPRTEDGVWVSADGERAVLLANVAAAGADLDAQAAALASVRQTFAAAAPPGLTLKLSGSPVFSVESRALIESEVKTLAIAGTVMVSVLLLLAFGSPVAVGVAMLPVATGVVAGIAVVGAVFGNVHGITLGFGATLMGEAVDYGIYYLIQAHRLKGSRDPVGGWRMWLKGSWPTVRLGLATSVCGFAALAFSGFPGLAQLGVFSCAGLVAAALATRFVLPVLLPDGAQGRGLRRPLGKAAAAVVRTMPRLRVPLLALGAAAVVGLLWQGSSIWSADLSALSPIGKDKIALNESLRADLTDSAGGLLVVVQEATVDATLQRAEAVGKQLETLIDSGVLAGYNSVTRWLPSAETQRQRLASLPDASKLQTALAEATAGGPLKAERLAPFVRDVEAARSQQPVTPAALRDTAVAPLVDALLTQRKAGGWSALLPVQFSADDPANAPLLRNALAAAQLNDGVYVLDIKPELDRLYDRYLGEAQTQTALGAGAVLVLMALWLRSWRRLLAVCQPLLLAVLLTLAALALLQVPLGILHLVGLLLVVAVGSNYALFFDMLQHAPLGAAGAPYTGETHDTLASLALANLTTVLSFGLIGLSSIPALSSIGCVVAPGALLALLLAAAFAQRRVTPLPCQNLRSSTDGSA